MYQAILRQKPGEIALAAGWFDLVSRHGMSAHLPIEVKRGERLPSPDMGDDLQDASWVLTEPTADEAAQAA